MIRTLILILHQILYCFGSQGGSPLISGGGFLLWAMGILLFCSILLYNFYSSGRLVETRMIVYYSLMLFFALHLQAAEAAGPAHLPEAPSFDAPASPADSMRALASPTSSMNSSVEGDFLTPPGSEGEAPFF